MTDEAQVRAAIDEVISREGRIDILVNNAGFGISGAAELTDTKDSHAQLELNVFGTDNVTRAVLPHMRAHGGGRIVCMSSIAGIVPIPFQLWYSVSKAAIIAYVLALQNEVKPFNISVCAIMPGDIASGFTDARKSPARGTTCTPDASSAQWPSWSTTSARHEPGVRGQIRRKIRAEEELAALGPPGRGLQGRGRRW